MGDGCKIEGCKKPRKALGLCDGHYTRLKRHGDPFGGGKPRNGAPQRYLVEVVVPFAGQECLVWPFARTGVGYGHLIYEGRQRTAHRVACELVHGAAPSPKHEAAHLCGKGHEGCVNPTHLQWKTSAENKADKVLHGTALRGAKNHKTTLTEDQVLEIRALRGVVRGKDLAQRFGVCPATITGVQKRTIWAWL